MLSDKICDIVNLALDGVYEPGKYRIRISFPIKRGKTECEIKFSKNGQVLDQYKHGGGGVSDVAAFALNEVCKALKRPKLAPIRIADEPFKNLSEKYREGGAEIINVLSRKLGTQVILVTHVKEIAEAMDKSFTVSQKENVSCVRINH
jgi:ABC-type dipeptide/oligopeptide/nickel transport system ATPase component